LAIPKFSASDQSFLMAFVKGGFGAFGRMAAINTDVVSNFNRAI
jgi:hypothetical protein